MGAVVLLLTRLQQAVSRGRFTLVSVAAGVAVAALLSVALVDGGFEMVMGADAAPVTSRTSTGMSGMHTSPAGAVALPDPNMQMEPGMKMARATCTSAPTSAQRRRP